jgi:hypothetical protein
MAVVLDIPWDGQSFSPPSPLDIATIEAAIVVQLQARINAIEIVHYPDRPEAYRMSHRVGAALVSYTGSTYGDLNDTGAIVQDRRLDFEVRLLARDLGWAYGGPASGTSPGAYALLEAIRAALTGFIIPGCRKIYPVKERFVERDVQGGVFIYAINFAVWTVAVESQPTPNYPLFIKGLALEQAGQTSATVVAAVAFASNDTITLAADNVTSLIVTAGGVTFIAGIDYTLDAVNGIITRLASGAIAAEATVDIAYSYADTVSAASGDSTPFNTSGS